MELTSYLLGKKAGGGGGGDTPDLSEYFETEITTDTTTSSNYSSNLVKMTAPLTLLNTITDLTGCFYESGYKGIDVSQMDTSNVTKMTSMFQNCSALEEIKGIGNLDVSNVTQYRYMFSGCSKLKKLDLSNWQPKSSGLEQRNMFYSCKKMAVLDISSFSKIGDYSFIDCGINCLQSDGAYADGIPYIYVKNASLQSNILAGMYGASSQWTSNNIIVKGQ